jgi:hypothetical protein
MTMKRALGAVVMLALLACGPGGDTPTSGPDGAAQRASTAPAKDVKDLKDHFVWGDESQPARDWDGDAVECEGRADADPSVVKGAHPLVRVGLFMKCMEEMGWTAKNKGR